MLGGNKKRFDARILRIAFLGILLLALCSSLFSQSNPKGKAIGQGKLEAALDYLDASMMRPGQTVDVIIQFEDDATPGETVEVKNLKRLARRQLILDTGGEPGRDFDSFPMHSAKATVGALKRLEQQPQVQRISVDYALQGHLATTAKAIGADQVWAGNSGTFGATGKGITVAVIDSGVGDNGLSAWDLWTQVRTSLNFVSESTNVYDTYGHGTHVAGIIAGTGKTSKLDDRGTYSGFAAQYKGIAPARRFSA